MPDSSFTCTCPHCESKMRLKDSALIGKKIRCPRCKEPFQVEAHDQVAASAPVKKKAPPPPVPRKAKPPASRGDPEEEEEIRPAKNRKAHADHEEDEEDEEERPVKKKKKKKKSSSLPLILIGGGAAAVIAIVILVVVIMNQNTGSPQAKNPPPPGNPPGGFVPPPGGFVPPQGGNGGGGSPAEPTPKVTANKLGVIDIPGRLEHIHFSSDGKVLYWISQTSKPTEIHRWDVVQKQTMPSAGQIPASGVLSPDGRLLAYSTMKGQAFDVTVWDVEGKKPVTSLTGLPGGVPMFAKMRFSGDGKRLIYPTHVKKNGADVGQVSAWEVETAQKKGEIELEDGIIRQNFSSNGKIVVCIVGGLLGKGAELWNVDTNEKHKLAFGGESSFLLVNAGDVDADGKILATTYFQDAKLFDVNTKKVIANLQSGQFENLFHLAMSANGKMVAAVPAQQKYVIVWHVPSRSKVARFDTDFKTPEVVLSPDGRYLAAYGMIENKVEVWELSIAASPAS